MSIPLSQLTNELDPRKTVLFFGAGSSVPSNAPTVRRIIEHLGQRFNIDPSAFSLQEIAGIIESKHSRKHLIESLRELFKDVRPSGGIANISLYNWKSIYTTNYDNVIEQSYAARGARINICASNFDFRSDIPTDEARLFKLHGSIHNDITDNRQNARIILSDTDYDETLTYREALYQQLKSDLCNSNLIIIGSSLSDVHIKEIINKAMNLNNSMPSGGQVYLLLYSADEDRASLYEKRGIRVAFGGIDEFFAGLAKRAALVPELTDISGSLIDHRFPLRPVTLDVSECSNPSRGNASALFNGWPATYADIAEGLTFDRSLAADIHSFLKDESKCCAVILGASGVGKTTTARQTGLKFSREGLHVWEHLSDHRLLSEEWLKVADDLRVRRESGILIVDDAHAHLNDLNDLVDGLVAADNGHLNIIATSSRNLWAHRIKSPNFFHYGREFFQSTLAPEEIERLIALVDTKSSLRALVENTFSGFSKTEKKRRLTNRCEADMFVCMKNIFASETYDGIILREFATLAQEDQDIYRHVSAMEAAGIRVHRQLIIRLLGVPAMAIEGVLSRLTDIIHEYDISEKQMIFGWRTRHPVIAGIIARARFGDIEKTIELFERVIDNVIPTYPIEIRTINELCNLDTGLPRISDKKIQNRLLRKMISVAPGERVPRHRLIRNLIAVNQFEEAETEIRLFEKDFRVDAPVYRFKIQLMVARATQTRGIMEEDRIAILEEARDLALYGAERYNNNRHILAAYAELGIEYYKRTKKNFMYEEALELLREAEQVLGDPEVSRLITRLDRRMGGQWENTDMGPDEIDGASKEAARDSDRA